jgi:hypothetical protein
MATSLAGTQQGAEARAASARFAQSSKGDFISPEPDRKPPREGASSTPWDWVHFASRTGEAGRAWVAEYRGLLPCVRIGDRGVELLHRHRYAEGRATLDEFARAIDALGPIPSSMRSVMDRWYHGAIGYYFYSVGEFDRAVLSMQIADQAVVDAISETGFLTPMAIDCLEFCLHQARISRNRRDWPGLRAHLDRARAIALDREPLCRTREGHAISFSTLAEFYRSLEPLTPEEWDSARPWVDPEVRVALFDKFVRRLLRLPGFAIQYP